MLVDQHLPLARQHVVGSRPGGCDERNVALVLGAGVQGAQQARVMAGT